LLLRATLRALVVSDSRHRPTTSKNECELLRPRGRRTLDWIGGKPRLGTYETLLASLATRHPHLNHVASLPGTLCTKAGYFIELTREGC
jgi:hypothetical protein